MKTSPRTPPQSVANCWIGFGGGGERKRHHGPYRQVVAESCSGGRGHRRSVRGRAGARRPPGRRARESPSVSSPPCSATCWATMARPSPVPSAAVVARRARTARAGARARAAGMPGPSSSTRTSERRRRRGPAAPRTRRRGARAAPRCRAGCRRAGAGRRPSRAPLRRRGGRRARRSIAGWRRRAAKTAASTRSASTMSSCGSVSAASPRASACRPSSRWTMRSCSAAVSAISAWRSRRRQVGVARERVEVARAGR